MNADETRETLIHMLKQLQADMEALYQQGAGYYTCIPLARRYNKLLGRARELLAASGGIIDTFDDLPENDPKDPSEKSKVVQEIKVESRQLVTLLESARKHSAGGEG